MEHKAIKQVCQVLWSDSVHVCQRGSPVRLHSCVSIWMLVSCMEPQLPCCPVCSNRGCCQSHGDPAILQGSEGRGQWGDTGIVGRYGVNRPGPVTGPTWKQKAVTSSPGKFSDASKVADLDFRSMVRRHLSYNSLSSWRAERDTEDMRSFCYLSENRGERWPQSRVIGAFQRHGIWITMLTM